MKRGAKTLSQKLQKKAVTKPLDLIIFGHEKLESLYTETEPIDSFPRSLRQRIERMKLTANIFAACSLSANQVALEERVFIMSKKLKDGVWIDWESDEMFDYKTIVNPRIIKVSKERAVDKELCPSFLSISALVPRYERIKVNYFNEDMEEITEELEGFEARVFQHELDHLNGFNILDKEVSEGEFELLEQPSDMNFEYKQALEEYSRLIKSLKKDFPELFNKKLGVYDANKLDDAPTGPKGKKAKQVQQNLWEADEMFWKNKIRATSNDATQETEYFDRLCEAAKIYLERRVELTAKLQQEEEEKERELNNDSNKK